MYMNIYEMNILKFLSEETYSNQRTLAESTGHSLGIVNQSITNLINKNYINADMQLTAKAKKAFKKSQPQNAIILAAGFGMRMVPINTETPKAFLEVKGELLIERIIRQLHEVGIDNIYVVVGFMKEQFEYLIDDFNVKLIVTPEYNCKNNLHSLYSAVEHLSNTYIIPCDIWCRNNPFSSHELYSWYMVSDTLTDNSSVRINRKMELKTIPPHSLGNAMIGIAYVTDDVTCALSTKLKSLAHNPQYDNSFWEDALFDNANITVYAKELLLDDVAEINTYEQLRELDNNSNHLQTEAIDIISQALQVSRNDINNISILKKGMTNRSFLFTCNSKRYIMRIPGEGTEFLINRKQEAQVYDAISSYDLCDDIYYINPENGYKITNFMENARVCDPLCEDDIAKCMDTLRRFHNLQLCVEHEFDIFKQIDFYESLWNNTPSAYKDYKTTKNNVLKLQKYIASLNPVKVLTHIDAVPDNFLFTDAGIKLIDWEYAGMQDPHVDIAMFCIYSLYDQTQIDHLIDIYFEGKCTKEIRLKIYCYISACGLLWSNWCEYKRNLGIEFGEYSLRQYRYAKEYFRIVESMVNLEEITDV